MICMDLNFSELMWISSISIPDSEYRLDLGLSTECTECQAFFPVVRIGSTHPLSARECCSSHSLAGGVSGGTQFRRKDRHTFTLGILYNPSTGLSICQENTKISKTDHNFSPLLSLFCNETRQD
jgi:hypothetical protein